jgi:hypothetical protein
VSGVDNLIPGKTLGSDAFEPADLRVLQRIEAFSPPAKGSRVRALCYQSVKRERVWAV